MELTDFCGTLVRVFHRAERTKPFRGKGLDHGTRCWPDTPAFGSRRPWPSSRFSSLQFERASRSKHQSSDSPDQKHWDAVVRHVLTLWLWRGRGFRDSQGIAAYRQSVLVAFKEVQDALTATRLLADQSAAVDRTTQASRRASELARKRFDAGFVGYIDVIDSQRTELVAERAAAQVAGLRFVTAVQLIKALGGGWSSDTSSTPAASP